MTDTIIPIKDRPILSLKPKVKIEQQNVPVVEQSKEVVVSNDSLRTQKQKDAMKILIQLFPKCFFDSTDVIERKKVKPLKIGIFDDIIRKEKWKEQNISNRTLRTVLYWYTHTLVYRIKMTKSKYRINLRGRFDEENCVVLEDDKKQARRYIIKFMDKRKKLLKKIMKEQKMKLETNNTKIAYRLS